MVCGWKKERKGERERGREWQSIKNSIESFRPPPFTTSAHAMHNDMENQWFLIISLLYATMNQQWDIIAWLSWQLFDVYVGGASPIFNARDVDGRHRFLERHSVQICMYWRARVYGVSDGMSMRAHTRMPLPITLHNSFLMKLLQSNNKLQNSIIYCNVWHGHTLSHARTHTRPACTHCWGALKPLWEFLPAPRFC